MVDIGISTRREAQEGRKVTGTRMKNKVKKTANEGNRFYFETFKDDEKRSNFFDWYPEKPGAVAVRRPLKYFSREEQLAYWLNLYNVTVLNEIIAIYPKKNLKKYTVGKKSIFVKKLLTVAGVPLSLNDIEFTILKQNYDNNPLVIYGLYKGIIGGPNIRRRRLHGDSVFERTGEQRIRVHQLQPWHLIRRRQGRFRVSSFYDRNRAYFPNFEADLTAHLEEHLSGKELPRSRRARIKAEYRRLVRDRPDGNSSQRIGGSFATSRAALLDSVRGTMPLGYGDPKSSATGRLRRQRLGSMVSKGAHLQRIDPGLLAVLKEIDDKRNAENQRNAAVTIEDLEENREASDEESQQRDGTRAGTGR